MQACRFLALLLAVVCLPSWAQTTASVNPADSTAQKDIPPVLQQTDNTAEIIKNVKLSNLRLGFVNFRRIMSTIPQLASIRKMLDEEFKDQKNALLQAQNELDALERKAQQSIGNADYDTLAQTLITKRREVARQDAQLRDDYSVRRNEEIAKLQNLVLEQIVGLAKEQNFDVILNDTGVIYVSEKADLTQLVIERLNQLAKQGINEQDSAKKAETTNQANNAAPNPPPSQQTP